MEESESKRKNSAVSVGETAPDFTLKGAEKNRGPDGSPCSYDTYSLSEHTENGSVLLGVYPWDFSPVCTKMMCQLEDMNWYHYKTDLSIFRIATEGPYSHAKFARELDLEFPLLCDTDGSVLEEYGVLNDELNGIKHGPQRSLFLIDSDRTVRHRWVADDNWDEGDFGLNPVQATIREL